MTKPFDQSLHDSVDPAARKAMIDYLKKIGYAEVEEGTKYGWDVRAVTEEGKGFFFEVEVKTRWNSGPFPFRTIHVPERKGDKVAPGDRVVFVSWRTDLRRFVAVTTDDLIRAGKKVLVKNIYNPMGEWFYDVPAEEAEEHEV